MNPTIDNVFALTFTDLDHGIGRNCGFDDFDPRNLGYYSEPAQLSDVRSFDQSLADGSLQNHFLETSNALFAVAERESASFATKLDDIADFMRPGLSSTFEGFELEGADNSPQGFGPSRIVSLIIWVYIGLAKERFLKSELGIEVPQSYEDNRTIFSVGHIPCGWKATVEQGKLTIF